MFLDVSRYRKISIVVFTQEYLRHLGIQVHRDCMKQVKIDCSYKIIRDLRSILLLFVFQ